MKQSGDAGPWTAGEAVACWHACLVRRAGCSTSSGGPPMQPKHSSGCNAKFRTGCVPQPGLTVPAYWFDTSSPWSAHSTRKRASTWRPGGRGWRAEGEEEWAQKRNQGRLWGQNNLWAEFAFSSGPSTHSESCCIAHTPTTTPTNTHTPTVRTSGKAWGRVAPSGMRPRRASTCSTCFLPSMPCRRGGTRKVGEPQTCCDF